MRSKTDSRGIRIDNDDDAVSIIDKVNKLLASYELEFVDDGQAHDGYIICTLEKHPHVDYTR